MKREPEVKKILKILTDFVTARAITVSGVTLSAKYCSPCHRKAVEVKKIKKSSKLRFVFFFWFG